MIDLPWLEPWETEFPPTQQALAEPNGLLAGGGSLNVDTLLNAYRHGIFPWFDEDQPILWWSPSPRAVVIPGQEHISKSLAKFIRNSDLQVRYNTAFDQVMRACAAPRNYSDETWISEQMIDAYQQLHQQGFAHSVECWQGEKLVAGLYGIAIGSIFFGESMFTRVSNGSKLAFAHLCGRLKAAEFALVDCQVRNNHLDSLGAIQWSREKFESELSRLIEKPSKFCPFV